ncbi:hypothetical protein EPO04_03025 [Patescibacteria group bacterium]|nr:MAG: hypothetical protein EPO04_03025 [Patescibacteria group bacterium]
MAQTEDTSVIIHQQCEELIAQVKQFRDYATTPNSTWLAKSELNRIQALISEIEQVLQRIDSPAS